MGKGLFWIAALGAPVAAIYFWDEKKGKKRRAHLRKSVENCMTQTEDFVKQYSKEYGPAVGSYFREAGRKAGDFSRTYGKRASELSREYGTRVQELAADAGTRAGEAAKNGHMGWMPSARMLGAVASAIAFYGAGRPGLLGAVLRTVSLGVFTRALMTSR